MSYILDALRKAEQKRQLAAKVPTLATIHRQPVPGGSPIRTRVWLWVAGAAIVVNAGIVMWLLLPAGPKPTASLDRPASSSTPGAPVSGEPRATPSPPPVPTPPAAGDTAPPSA